MSSNTDKWKRSRAHEYPRYWVNGDRVALLMDVEDGTATLRVDTGPQGGLGPRFCVRESDLYRVWLPDLPPIPPNAMPSICTRPA